MLFARSPRSEQGIPAQSYEGHINGVLANLRAYLGELKPYCSSFGLLARSCLSAGMYHDLGKLDDLNQEILSGSKKARRLPVNHCDAGVKYLSKYEDVISSVAAILVNGHHIGLPSIPAEIARGDLYLRYPDSSAQSDKYLDKYLSLHNNVIVGNDAVETDDYQDATNIMSAVFMRIAMSCLVDADHSDAASVGGLFYSRYGASLKPMERLKALDSYIESIESLSSCSNRNRIRHNMYKYCSTADCPEPIYCCDSPVGTGKTTAIMANLLKVAENKKLRRIFVILPYTNIIEQSVEIYRKALALDGENPEEIVSALHHRTEYEAESLRYFSSNWNAPIIVTTAVQFFETLAAATPSSLRKLHNLPGSAVFIDESHAVLPAKLWPQAWAWLKIYAEQWSSHIVLASGSLNRFWKIEEFDPQMPDIPELLPKEFSKNLILKETNRVKFCLKDDCMNEYELVEWLVTLAGPRLLIVNTVQSAAVIAKQLADIAGRDKVEHMSTSLTPSDRKTTLERIKQRLALKEDTDWTLVATSCVEAGVDFSFRTGIREAASLVSLLQVAGRVRRNDEANYSDSAVWVVELNTNGLLKHHPAFNDSSKILLGIMQTETVSPSLCTRALREEILKSGALKRKNNTAGELVDKFSESEAAFDFQDVENEFKVINTETVTVIVDEVVAGRIANYEKVNWRDIQKGSVQIWCTKVSSLGLDEIRDGIFRWKYEYDDFLGYMAGVVKLEEINKDGFAIV